jgi:predicted HAD superfamily Cof-like phosphohydrolase
MKTKQDKVREFMLHFNQDVVQRPCVPDLKTQEFRLSLNLSELFEIVRDIEDPVKRVDGFCDLLYTTYGWANVSGVHLNKQSEVAEALPDNKIAWWLGHCSTNAAFAETADGIQHWLNEVVDGVFMWASKLGVTASKLDECFEEVHRSNMAKLWSVADFGDGDSGSIWPGWSFQEVGEGKFIAKDETGKVRKPPGWQEPKLKEILEAA